MVSALVLTAVGALAAYFVFAAVKYTRMISNIFMSLVYRPSEMQPFSADGERFTVLDSSDREIDVLYIGPKNAERLVIFCHESGSSKESWERYAHFLPAAGYGVVSLDFTKPSDAPDQRNIFSQWPSWEETERVVSVLRWSRKAISAKARVALFGVSNGADMALAASVREGAVRAVVADGLFSMKESFRDRIRYWAPIVVRPNFFGERLPEWLVRLFADLGFAHCQKKSGRHFVDIEPILKRKHAPLLLIQGENDEYIPALHRERLKAAGASRDEHLLVEKAGHNEAVAVAPADYQRRVVEFLAKALA